MDLGPLQPGPPALRLQRPGVLGKHFKEAPAREIGIRSTSTAKRKPQALFDTIIAADAADQIGGKPVEKMSEALPERPA